MKKNIVETFKYFISREFLASYEANTTLFICLNCYRPQRSCGQGNVFTGVCDSVHRGGPPEAGSGIRSMSGRYASCWNAFLLYFKDALICFVIMFLEKLPV